MNLRSKAPQLRRAGTPAPLLSSSYAKAADHSPSISSLSISSLMFSSARGLAFVGDMVPQNRELAGRFRSQG